MTRRATIALVAVLVGILGSSLTACAPSATGETADTMTPPVAPIDFASLTPPDSPNNWFVAPADFSGAAQPDETAPVFEAPAPVLAEAWRATIDARPRTEFLAVSDDGLRLEARQKSAVFGFVDRVSVEVLPLAADRSTFAAYSTSLAGYWDMGVNRRRLRDWIAEVRRRAADGAAATGSPHG